MKAKPFTPIGELGKKAGEEVSLRGWIYRTRSSKDMTFIVLRDSTGIVQCVRRRQGLP
jgi:asparaginyl-tRNA synthetase